MKQQGPTVLCILDGFGLAPPSKGNAVSLAKLPVYDRLARRYPTTQLKASGAAVGLPAGQAGNSEAGHTNIGAGRIATQDTARILDAIDDGSFLKNPAFISALKYHKRSKQKVHLMGLLSHESAHSHPKHLASLLQFCQQKKIGPVYLHLFTDGRDAPPHSAIKFLHKLEKQLNGVATIASITGRYYAMDRNKWWARTEQAYRALTEGRGQTAETAEAAILQAYNRGETDEFIKPTVLQRHGKPVTTIDDDDVIFFFNLRSDRARQLTKPFVQPEFEKHGGFTRRKKLKNIYFVALTDFGPDLDTVVTAFPSIDLKGTLPMALGQQRSQLYIAETEKYAHVTYFMNGGYADPVAGEERILIPSANVKQYNQKPAMSAPAITRAVVKSLAKQQHQLIVMNYANPDMVGHTGDIPAAVEALEVVDAELGKVYEAVTAQGGTLLVTADHGNCEDMLDLKTGEALTEHTTNPVPFILVGERHRRRQLKKRGELATIAPTVLDCMAIDLPADMTRTSLIRH